MADQGAIKNKQKSKTKMYFQISVEMQWKWEKWELSKFLVTDSVQQNTIIDA